ncbi:MAG TPA: hypothetical protein PK718_05135 [Candidatus Methanofastidiosa archaeon]|nr:hypothetical protein [Candidatus Methanofastidiosa archaeon]
MENGHIGEVTLACIENMLIACSAFDYTGDLGIVKQKLGELEKACGDKACGDPFLLFNWGERSVKGYAAEACYPVTAPVTGNGIYTKEFEGGEAFTLGYRGGYGAINDGYKKIFRFAHERGVQPGMEFLEVYRSGAPVDDGNDEMELIMMIHPWMQLLKGGLEDVLGREDSLELIRGLEDINPMTDLEDRFSKIKWFLEDLEGLSDDDQRYEIMSGCADRFSKKRIKLLRDIYLKKRNVDDVIDFMKKEQDWYSEPWRDEEGIHIIKVPYRRKEYDKAETPEEKRKYYCHCPIVRGRLDDGMPSTYCLCGSGWFRQVWEGILERPVRVRMLRSLLKGDDCCEFVVEMPP